jgi:hypothetical protein
MEKLTFDSLPFKSQRTTDDNGFLHVAISNITKEQVVPYRGDEIPLTGGKQLDPDRLYYAYRPASELKRDSTVNSLNGIPILLNHHPDYADAPQKKYRVGSTGTDAKFNAPYLTNSLHITDEDAIKRIKDGSMKELSLGYRYTPVFQEGTFDGQHYDFIMTNISCNHVALVEQARAGADVYVEDSKANLIEDKSMNDEKIEQAEVALADSAMSTMQALKDLHEENPVTDEVQDVKTTSEITGDDMDEVQDKEVIREELLKEIGDAGLDVEKFKEKLEILAKPDEAEDEDIIEEENLDKVEAEDEDTEDKVDAEDADEEDKDEIALDADTAKACGLDADDPNVQKAFAEGVKYGERMEKKEPKKLDSEHESEGEKKALTGDSAERIANLVAKRLEAKYQAVEDVKRTLGNVRATAYDSAGDIYRAALKAEGVSTKGLNDNACRATYRAISAVKAKGTKRMAMDSGAKVKNGALDSFFNKVNVGV